MYITDATHFLDEKGAIGPKDGPGRRMAEFFGSVIVATTHPEGAKAQPSCWQCGGAVVSRIDQQDAVVWSCTHCEVAGRISNWRDTLWDMTKGADNQPAHH